MTDPSVSATTSTVANRRLVTFNDATDLREHLDLLNEAGITPVAVGIDATPQPFLITLVGPYADGEHVIFDSPWQTDCDYGEMVDGKWVSKPPYCDECMAQVHGMEHLRFPVTVLAQEVPDGT